ncbi:amino acid permease [Listeria monocytogenes]|uniref:Amino acid permease n=6 Tax=Listeria monocytogenes TaxID=1639 RepID=A0A0B8QPX6_LISMN|nr:MULTISPECIES: amino acid permease [Listeria]EAD5035308.1 amino acid permease [Listeria monocytogenes serotype 1/2a]EAE1680004.1 amino acid permease [Listeria monocytogenes LIS0071]EAE3704448.1 amino acid permease [Listeria monocytogenes serotype 1/2b]EAG6252064.1 amino acid permease [Listeria monocytogenes CFSAN003806]EAG6261413.1 amino acid permease [Listeria monocytogenes CFSAN003725]EAG6331112.1 amino acid permease [Listeria monocytogenes CFSAN002346]EAG6350968.1 amino acid permease [L
MKKETHGEIRRDLKTRHLSMIAIGGSIGTGLFLASGNAIHTAGPGGALVAYIAIGIMVYFLMTSLGEMATYMPVSGSFSTYASRFVDPAFGFALGWNYWFNWAITLAVDISTAAIIVQFWLPNTPAWLWSAIFLILIFGLNALSVKAYGESEYWFSIIKVATVIIFLIVGVLTIVGILGGEVIGFSNFTAGDAPFKGGFFAILGTFLIAGFSFQGTEMVGIAAGESATPETSVPKAIKQVFWRILLFYIFAIFIIGMIIPYTNPNLLSAEATDVAISPFTLVFEKAGLAFAASVMNAVILTSVLSAGNSGLYASTRMLWAMARDKKAPKFLGKVNRRGIPMAALIVTTIVGAMTFITTLTENGTVIYTWLLSASGLTGFIAWVGIAISHYRFRKAFIKQGHDLSELKYKAKFFPFGPILALILCILVIVGQDYAAFLKPEFTNPAWWQKIGISYIGLPIFLVFWLSFKFTNKTKVIPLEDCKFDQK